MSQENMVISEEWRWRLLTIWVVIFTALVVYALVRIDDVTDVNRTALCSIHRSHLADKTWIKLLLEKGGEDVEEINQEIAAEEADLANLGCEE